MEKVASVNLNANVMRFRLSIRGAFARKLMVSYRHLPGMSFVIDGLWIVIKGGAAPLRMSVKYMNIMCVECS
jgi:hypothetical protein